MKKGVEKSLADRVANLFNLRILVAGMALLLALLPAVPPSLGWLDQLVFRLGLQLHNVPTPDMGISLVELPDEEVVFLTQDSGRAERTYQLLNRITASDKISVGLVLPEALDSQPSGIVDLVGGLWNGEGAAPPFAGEQQLLIQRYLHTSGGLATFVDHPQVTVASPAFLSRVPVSQQVSMTGSFPGGLPTPEQLPLRRIGSVLGTERLLVRDQHTWTPSPLLDLYAKINRADEVIWQERDTLRVGRVQLPVSANGTFISYPHHASMQRISLDDALEQRLDHNVVLLGQSGSQELASLANALRSLDSSTYYRTPFWFSGVFVAVMLLTAFYLTVLLPKLSYAAGALATSLLVVILLVAQVGWQITQWHWLPMGLPVQLLVLGHVLMLLWKRQKERVVELQAAAHGARYQLGLQLFRDGRSDDALLAVKECFTTEAVLGLMYDLASQQERKRHYGEALKTYRAIVERQKNFRDAAEKVEKLMAFSSGGAATLSGDTGITKTLIISESSINKPVLGRYEIERELGRGAMGIVYLGRDPKIARPVAIKTLSYGQLDSRELEQFKQRFFREAEAAGRLNHPNIVTIYDVGEEHDLAFIAMDYVPGNALNAYISEDKRMAMRDVFRIVAEAADALDYAHGQQVIHRDVKPANIMFNPQTGHVKVTDFGVARIVDSAKTNTGDILGSPLYMSPEQLKGARVDRQTDIYSLGVTLFQLLTGELPFTGDTLASLTYNIIHQKAPGIRQRRPDLPTGITRIMNRALHKEPAKRFASAAEMADALRKLAGEAK
ncbi:serine/threonine protein kinase [Proteobacteria bacterium 005FR1]|nr:serine/threonine protein kinase [Proteobacteria bacterium 005FR1]